MIHRHHDDGERDPKTKLQNRRRINRKQVFNTLAGSKSGQRLFDGEGFDGVFVLGDQF